MNTKKVSDNDELEIERTSEPELKRPAPDKDDISAEESFSSSDEIPIESPAVPEEASPEQLKEMLIQAEDKYLRLAAEFENYKKRNTRQFEEYVQNAEAELFKQILEVFDNLKRAIEQPENQKNFESFKSGMKLIYEQMKRFLDKYKIEPIKAIGQKFNPDIHEAVMQIESEEHPEGTVASELGGGFKRGEKVIRHAKVGVSKGKGKKH